MKVTGIRRTLAGLAAVGIVSAAGTAGVAAAATRDTTARSPSLELSAQPAQPSPTGTRLPAAEGSTTARVSAHSTGDGPADDRECEAWGDFINSVISMGQHDLNEGRTESAANFAAEADRAESEALGRGCFVIH